MWNCDLYKKFSFEQTDRLKSIFNFHCHCHYYCVAASSQILHSSTGRDVKAEKSAKEEKSIKGDSEERTIELLRRLLFFLSFSRSLLSISYCRLTGSA